jgi:hypothetical protein
MSYITPETTGNLPDYLSPSAGLEFADAPKGLAAVSKVPAAGWGHILAYLALCETSAPGGCGFQGRLWLRGTRPRPDCEDGQTCT